MKKDLSDLKFKDLSIKNPCSANWQEMDAQTGGRFCRNCQKQVIDFTDKTEDELRAIVSENGKELCGRFRKSQISGTLSSPEKPSKRTNFFKKAAATAATLAILQTSTHAADPPAQPKVETNDNDRFAHSAHSPNTVVTGVVLTQDDENIPDDILVKLVYQSKDGQKTLQQHTRSGLFHFDLAGKATIGSPVVVIVPAQTLKEGHIEHKYFATRLNATLSESQNLLVRAKVEGLWDDMMIMGDIEYIGD